MMCLLGKFNLSDSNEVGSVSSFVWDIFIHPEWNFASEQYHADIAVIVLMDSIKFTNQIQPVCLPKQSSDEVKGVGVVAGWGKTEHLGLESFDETPSKVQIPAVNELYCNQTYPKLAHYSSHATFCGGYENKGKAPCLGDSGGGFYLKSRCHWKAAGIVSGSLADQMNSCDINKFQIYTNVARFADWINQVMQKTKNNEHHVVELDCE